MRLKNVISAILLLLGFGGAGFGQTIECAKITKRGNEITFAAKSIRVVDSIANTLAQQFGVAVSAEDPEYHFLGDLEDVREADPEWADQHPKANYVVPKSRAAEIRFSVLRDGTPNDVVTLLHEVVEEINRQSPFGYRLDVDGQFFTFVPTTTHDTHGNIVPATPLLDRRITIQLGKRRIAESAQLMVEALSAQTGLHISCCQAWVAEGRPWGMAIAQFGADNEPARHVLERLILFNDQWQDNSRNYWLLRCDSGWCSINVESVWGGQCR